MKEKCKNCEILESGSIIRLDLNGDCIFCGRNLHTQIVLQEPMTHTEKVLEEMRKHREYQLWKESPDVKYLERREIYPAEFAESFLSTSITQARAEERERLLREIDEMKGYTVNIPVIDPSLGELTESDIDFVEHINGQILFKNKVKQNLTNKNI